MDRPPAELSGSNLKDRQHLPGPEGSPIVRTATGNPMAEYKPKKHEAAHVPELPNTPNDLPSEDPHTTAGLETPPAKRNNEAVVPSLTFYNIGGFLSRVDVAKEKAAIDFSYVTFIEPFALVYLGLFLRYHNSRGKYFNWTEPNDKNVREYLSRTNFYKRFGLNSHDTEAPSLSPFSDSTSFNDVIDIEKGPGIAEEVSPRLKKLLVKNHVTVDVETICFIAEEITDNFAQHSGEELAVMTVQRFPQKKWISIAFGDCGKGIKTSLAQNPKYRYLEQQSDREAILKAFEPMVSRREQAGMGLPQVKEAVVESKGTLLISSNAGYLAIREGKPWWGDLRFNLPGVQMEIAFPEKE